MLGKPQKIVIRATVQDETQVPATLKEFTMWLDKAKGPALKGDPNQRGKGILVNEDGIWTDVALDEFLEQTEKEHRLVLAWYEKNVVKVKNRKKEGPEFFDKTYINLVYFFVRKDVAFTSEKVFNFHYPKIRAELGGLVKDYTYDLRRFDDNAIMEKGKEVEGERRWELNVNNRQRKRQDRPQNQLQFLGAKLEAETGAQVPVA